MLDATLLRSLIAVADSGGFTRAASRLNLTQSAVSAHIRRLEAEVGQRLLDRTTRSVALTPAGNRLVGYARMIVALHQDARASLGAGRPLSGGVCVGASEEMAGTTLAECIRRFSARHPGVEISLKIGLTNELLTCLQAGGLDLVLGSRCGGDPRGDILWSEPLIWAAAPNFRIGDDPAKPVPLAVYPDTCPYRAVAIEALVQAGRRWRIACESASRDGLSIALAAGLGIAPLTRAAASSAGLRAMAGLPRLPDADFGVMTGPKISPVAAALADNLRRSVLIRTFGKV
ncbi:LysR substrate-binding domain-containing protein [Methylobacterium sp. J-077]|uniref:LysR substrate-binding domain-containing protein n=1 Tax=Methylobacterium sp. J-077 TaxID=2836656 RepID=UPI0024450C7C|nr:LysR substrate-binding domain-containing protein [Methylobacterium sp. J-077]